MGPPPPPRSRDPADSGEQVGHRPPGPEPEPPLEPPSGRCCAPLLPTRDPGVGSAQALRRRFQRAFVSGWDVGTLIFPHLPQEGFYIENSC